MSPAVQRALEGVREAAEYAASHPSGAIRIKTIRGYVRSNGRWYVEALQEDNPEPLAIDGLQLIQAVEEAKLREHFYGTGPDKAAMASEELPKPVQTPQDRDQGGHPIPSGQDRKEAPR